VFLEVVARTCVARERHSAGFDASLNLAHVRAWLIVGAILAFPLTAVAVALVPAF